MLTCLSFLLCGSEERHLKYWLCSRFLCNQTKDADLRKWAAEGLAYLTLDADIKEELVDDVNAIKSLIELAKVRITLLT